MLTTTQATWLHKHAKKIPSFTAFKLKKHLQTVWSSWCTFHHLSKKSNLGKCVIVKIKIKHAECKNCLVARVTCYSVLLHHFVKVLARGDCINCTFGVTCGNTHDVFNFRNRTNKHCTGFFYVIRHYVVFVYHAYVVLKRKKVWSVSEMLGK